MSVPAAGRAVNAPLIGRSRDFERATDAVNAGGGIVISGPVGVGKSRLASEVISGWKDVIIVRATASTATVPFGAFAQLVPRGALGPLLHRMHLFSSVEANVLEMGHGKPPVLFVDNANLLDVGSSALLLHLVSVGAVRPIVTVRSGESSPDAISALWRDELLPILHLDNLGVLAIAELAQHMLGAPLTAPSVRLLATLSGGNPLHLLYVLNSTPETSFRLEPNGELSWDGRIRGGSDLDDLASARIRTLSADGLDALRIVALGEPLKLHELRALTSREAMAEVENSGLISYDESESTVFVDQPLIGEVVRVGIPPTTRELLHDRLAVSIDDPDGGRNALLRAGVWRLRGSPDSADAAALTSASMVATEQFDPLLGERLAAHAMQVQPGLGAAIALAAALSGQRRFREAGDLLDRWWSDVLRASPDGPSLTACHLVVTVRAYGMAQGADAADLMSAVELSCDDPAWQARARALRADALASFDLDAAHALAEPICHDAGIAVATRIVALRTEVNWLCNSGLTDDARDLITTFTSLADAAAKEFPAGPPLVSGLYGYTAAFGGHLDEIERSMPTVLSMATKVGADDVAGAALLSLGICALARADVVQARDLLQEAVHHLSVAGNPDERLRALIPLVTACAHLGDRAAATRVIEEARHEMKDQAAQNPYLVSELKGAEAHYIALTEGAQAGSAAYAAAARAAKPLVWRSLFAVGARNMGAADDDLADIMREGAGSQSLILRAIAAHGEAVADGPDGTQLESVAALYEEIGFLFYAVETWIEASEVLARTDTKASRRAASRAKALLDGPVTGLNSPAVQRLRSPTLTKRERQIVQRAAAGRTNAEIADEYSLSIRTVEWHLLRACDKLGVSGRRELAPYA